MTNSTVYIKVAKQDEAELLKLLKESEFEPTREFENNESVGYVLYNVNWYYTHPDVQRINHFIDKTSEYLKGLMAFSPEGHVERHGSPGSIGMGFEYKFIW